MSKYGSGPSKEDIENNVAGWDTVGFGSGGSSSSSTSHSSSSSSYNDSGNDSGSSGFSTAYDKRTGIDYSRNPDRAGQIVRQGMYDVYYDDLGYAGKAVKVSDSPGYVVDGVTYDGFGNVFDPTVIRYSGQNGQNVQQASQYLQNLVSSDAPEWNGSQWDDLLNQVANQLASMNYADWTKGDQYKALADRYGNQGRMSMQDVLGQISSRTGGLASSYAATAAQQQYNDFMSQLEDIARQMYSNERSDMLNNANMYRQLSQDDYNQYLNDLSQWNADRSFNYGAFRDSVEDQRYADETAWEREQYGNTQSENQKSAAQDRIAAYLAAGGKIADLDQDLIAASGLTTSELSAQEKYYTQQAAAAALKSSGKSSGGSNSSGGTSQDYTGLFRAAYDSGDNAKSFIANNYGDYGFGKSTGLYDEYLEAAKMPVKNGFEMNADNFQATMQSIAAQLASGKTDAAESNVNRVWDQLSAAQKSKLQSLLGRYGLAAE